MTLHTGRFYALAFVALVLMFVSCEGEKPSHALAETGKGKVIVSMYSEIEVRSEVLPISDTDDYNFRFVGVDGYATSDYYRVGDVSWPMEWYYGLFRLEAESCTEKEAEEGYGKLRYAGIGQPFSVVTDQLATASVVCDIANFRVSVNFNDKMFMQYKDFKLVVDSVLAPVYEETEDGGSNMIRGEQLMRTLDMTTINKSGFYNLHSDAMNLRYTLYVMNYGATEFIESVTGYFTEEGSDEPAVISAGDYITLNVDYIGDVKPSEGIKIVINGERTGISNGFGIEDYIQGSVTEDE